MESKEFGPKDTGNFLIKISAKCLKKCFISIQNQNIHQSKVNSI